MIYIDIKAIENAPTVWIKNLESFANLMQLLTVEYLFVTSQFQANNAEQTGNFGEDIYNKTRQIASTLGVGNDNKSSYFSFIRNGVAYIADTQGFKTLEDYEQAEKLGFTNGNDFENAQKLEFSTAEEYLAFKENGFLDKKTYQNAKDEGFLGAKKAISKIESTLTDEAKASIKNLKNDAAIYHLAQVKNYKEFDTYLEAIKLGFAQHNITDFEAAKNQGFTSANTYFVARNRGFENAQQHLQANALKLENKFELDLFLELNTLKDTHNFAFHDHAHVFKILQELPNEQKIDLKNINDIFQSEQDKLKFQTHSHTKSTEWLSNTVNKFLKNNQLPDWYKAGFKTKEELQTFLISNQNISKIGKFDLSNEVFIKA